MSRITAPVASFKIRPTTPNELHMQAFSTSFVDDYATCPKYGAIKRGANKTFFASKRALALEAGSLMHEVFAAMRLWELERLQGLDDFVTHHALRIFPDNRYAFARQDRVTDERDDLIATCFSILNSGDFYDDPDDRIRTMANMEETVIKVCDYILPQLKRNPTWVKDPYNPTAPVGIEIPFDVIIEFEDYTAIRFIGTIDGISWRAGETLQIEEYKTASRLDETWRRSFETKHQVTSYLAVSGCVVGEQIETAHIFGTKVKQTRSAEDILDFVETRDQEQFANWAQTLYFVAKIAQEVNPDPLNAPMFTHSCSRYFRPCSLLDMCAASWEDQRVMFDNMVPNNLSPSQHAIGQKWLNDGYSSPFPNVDMNDEGSV